MKTQLMLMTLIFSSLVLAGCDSMGMNTGSQSAADRSQQIAEQVAAAAAMREDPTDPAELAWSRAVTLSEKARAKADAALAAGNSGDMNGYLTLKTEAMLAHRAAGQAWETANNYAVENSTSMAAQTVWESAIVAWESLVSFDQEMI